MTPLCATAIRRIVNRKASRALARVASGLGRDRFCHSAGSLISDPADSLVAGSAYGDFGAGRTCSGKRMSRLVNFASHCAIDLLAGCGYDAGGAPNSREAFRKKSEREREREAIM